MRIINFAVFEDFTLASKISCSKSYYSTESYDSPVDPWNLICEIYRGEITSKIFCLKNYPLYGNSSLWYEIILYWYTSFYTQGIWSLVATSVPSEQVFSVAGSVVDEKRSRLLPENVDKLVFLFENRVLTVFHTPNHSFYCFRNTNFIVIISWYYSYCEYEKSSYVNWSLLSI